MVEEQQQGTHLPYVKHSGRPVSEFSPHDSDTGDLRAFRRACILCHSPLAAFYPIAVSAQGLQSVRVPDRKEQY